VQSNVASATLATLALLNVIDWADKVVDDLHTMTWNKVRYKTCPDGNIDYSVPVYDKFQTQIRQSQIYYQRQCFGSNCSPS